MTALRQIVLNICFTLLIAGILRLLVPSGAFGKTVKWVIGVFMLVSLLTPFCGGYTVNGLFSFDLEGLTPKVDWLEEDARVLEQAAAAEAKSTVMAAAAQNGVTAQVLSVATEYRDSKVYITGITVVVEGDARQAQAVKRTVEQWINADISVQWTQEDGK